MATLRLTTEQIVPLYIDQNNKKHFFPLYFCEIFSFIYFTINCLLYLWWVYSTVCIRDLYKQNHVGLVLGNDWATPKNVVPFKVVKSETNIIRFTLTKVQPKSLIHSVSIFFHNSEPSFLPLFQILLFYLMKASIREFVFRGCQEP